MQEQSNGADSQVGSSQDDYNDSEAAGAPQPKAPLGALVDFDVRDQLDAEAALTFEYLPIERFPELKTMVEETVTSLDKIRQDFSLPPVIRKSDDVRLIPSETYDRQSYFRTGNDAAAFFEPRTGICFVRFNEVEFAGSQQQKARDAYTIAHELAHSSLGIPDSGHRSMDYDRGQRADLIDEGIADIVSKHVLGSVMEKLFHNDNDVIREYVSTIKPAYAGFVLRADDIFWATKGSYLLVYSRVPEMRVLEKINEINPQVFQAIMLAVFSGDRGKLFGSIRDTFGVEVYGLILKYSDSHEIIAKLEQRPDLPE